MLTGKQKSYLRGLANTEKAMVLIGKDGLSENIIESAKEYLKANELLKLQLLKNCDLDIREVAFDLASSTKSELVQIIGRTAVLYKFKKDGKIVLPR